MNANIITETVDNVTSYISLNNEGQIVSAAKNPMELPAFMTKEQAFQVITALRKADPDKKYRVKAVSQALRDMITDIIYNELPEAPVVADEVITSAIESWKPKVEAKKVEEQPAVSEPPAETDQPAEPETPVEAVEPEAKTPAEVTDAPVEEASPESKKEKKGKKQNK